VGETADPRARRLRARRRRQHDERDERDEEEQRASAAEEAHHARSLRTRGSSIASSGAPARSGGVGALESVCQKRIVLLPPASTRSSVAANAFAVYVGSSFSPAPAAIAIAR